MRCPIVMRGAAAIIIGTAMPSAAIADQKLDMRPSTQECVGATTRNNLPYPFSVARVERAYGIAQRAHNDVSDVHVMVIDNGFVGFQRGSPPSGGFSPNFPESFFKTNPERLPTTEVMEAPSDDVAGENLSLWGHGTHVVGVILGGAPEASDEGAPGSKVRRLFQHNSQNPWLSLYVVGIGDKTLELTRIRELNTIVARQDKYLRKQDIVNMSIIQRFTDDNDILPLPEFIGEPLFVAAAGNSEENLTEATHRFPAKVTRHSLLVVASHDADAGPESSNIYGASLSQFSNYGSQFVEIAAPGCQIRSWLRGKGDPTPLNGTSFATAIVTFTAALVRSLHAEFDSVMLKNRLVVSSRFSRALLNCGRGTDIAPVNAAGLIEPSGGCVRYGSQLDIEAALLAHTDVVEFCSTGSRDTCDAKMAYGTLDAIPASIVGCLGGRVINKRKMEGLGMSTNGAIRIVSPENAQILFPVMSGEDEVIEARNCPIADVPGESFKFKGAVMLDAQPGPPVELNLTAKQLLRIVTRSSAQ